MPVLRDEEVLVQSGEYIFHLTLAALHCAHCKRQGRSKGGEDGCGAGGREALSSGTGSLGGICHGPVRSL